jgi:uncharacterized protein YecE (DUF72 family)
MRFGYLRQVFLIRLSVTVMHFGRIEAFEHADYRLGPHRIVSDRKAAAPGRCIGLPVWGNKAFVGALYPEGTRAKDFLREYGRRFSCIELNATHYAMPDADKIRAWCNDVPDGFEFCPKFPKALSHTRTPDLGLLRSYADRLTAFGAKLGPSFLQFPEYADKSWKRAVFELSRAFPHKLAVELRHPDWFHDPAGTAKLCAYFTDHNIAFVITDTPGRRDVVHMQCTADTIFIRFLGNGLHASDFERIAAWSACMEAWTLAEKRTYFFLHQQNELDCLPLYKALMGEGALRRTS